jgi:hypothetical protein
MVTYYKGKIGEEDFNIGFGTFLRKNYLGASEQLNQVSRETFDIDWYKDVRDYTSFKAAVDAIGADNALLFITEDTEISELVTVPENIVIMGIPGYTFTGSYTVTFYSPENIISNDYLFDCTVEFTNEGTVKPIWWDIKNDDSTDNDISVLILCAYTSSCEIYWPKGIHRISATVANFHDVKHSGPGVIRFDVAGPIFAPVADVYNTSYSVPSELFINASTGADTNIGIDSTVPFLTIQACFDVIAKYGPLLGGYWKINLAAGTWTEGAEWTDIRSKNYVRIVGPDVAWGTPTAIIDGTGATKSRGLLFTRKAFVWVEGIKTRDFDDDSQHAGFQVGKHSQAYLINCHGYNNQISVFARDNSIIFIEGGILDGVAAGNGYTGLRVIGSTRYSTDYESTTGVNHTITIQNCGFGAYMWEHSNGHFDEVLCQSNTTGLFLAKNSRAAIGGTVFKGNTTGITASDGSTFLLSDSQATTFNHAGTPNDKDYLLLAYSKLETTLNSGFSFSDECIRTDHTYTSHTGDTDETTKKTYTGYVVANTLVDFRQQLRIKINGVTTGTDGTKTLSVKIDGDVVGTVVIPQTYADEWIFETVVSITEANVQKCFAKWSGNDINPLISYISETITMDDNASAMDITVTVDLGNSGDLLGIRNVEIWKLG